MNYRILWEKRNGPIPKDEDGRSYEIHHIDGNRKNNDITNLQCVSIAQHYDIHLSQGDKSAASYIAARMDKKPKDLKQIRSEATTEMNNKLVSQGKHWFQDKEWRERHHINNNKERVQNGTHNFIGSANNQKRLKEGTHNWQLAQKTVPVVNKQGSYLRIPSDVYASQSGAKDQWDYVHMNSNEGKRRLSS